MCIGTFGILRVILFWPWDDLGAGLVSHMHSVVQKVVSVCRGMKYNMSLCDYNLLIKQALEHYQTMSEETRG